MWCYAALDNLRLALLFMPSSSLSLLQFSALHFTDLKLNCQIWAIGRSTVGSGAESKVYGRNLPIIINDVSICPGDIIFADPLEGVVAIPNDLVDAVVDLMPKLVSADDKVKEDVEAGSMVQAAFKKHRN